MRRNLDDVITALPEDRQELVEARFEEMKAEVESLGQTDSSKEGSED